MPSNALQARIPVTRKLLQEVFPNSPQMQQAMEQLMRAVSPQGAVNATGELVPFGGASAPDGWLICDGSAISRVTYAELFSVIGTAWGAGDGVSTFNLPNMAGRTLIGASATYPLGTTGGAEPGAWSGLALEQDGGAPYALKQGASSGNHPSMPPYAAVNWLIKT